MAGLPVAIWAGGMKLKPPAMPAPSKPIDADDPHADIAAGNSERPWLVRLACSEGGSPPRTSPDTSPGT